MKVLHRKLLRTMRLNWGQSLAVAAVVLCGVASYIAVYSAYLNLMLTRDTYYQQYRFADFEVHLERVPSTVLNRVGELPGVREVRGRIVSEVNVDVPDVEELRAGRLVSMPVPERDVLNDLVIRSGRYFEPGAQEEVILSERFALANRLNVGDVIDVTIDNRRYALRIVGLGLSPEYVYMIRNIQELIPSPEYFGVLWVPETFAEAALDMKEARNNIIGTVDDIELLDRIFERVDDLLEPYGVYAKVKQEDQLSNRFVSDEIQNLGVMAQIMPTIFLGIAAMILFVLLSRMVRMERTQIGLLRAYGYTPFSVGVHYVQYALLLACSGCLGGFFFGQWIANGIINLYIQFYQFPLLESRVYPGVLARSMGITMFFATIGALSAAAQAARIDPATTMRPEAPRTGHRVWLETIPALWSSLSFTWKMILRNISRSAFRASLNVFGVMVSVALLILGVFTMDAMNYAMRMQFLDVQREDLKISFHREQGRDTFHDVSRMPHVRRAEPVLEYSFELSNGWRSRDVVITGLIPGAELQKLKNFNLDEVAVAESGIILSDRLARSLGVVPGDTVRLRPLMGRVTRETDVVVAQTMQQFLGMGAYMNIDTLSRILDEPFAMTSALLRIDNEHRATVNRNLKDIVGIAAVGFREDAYRSIQETLAESMRITNMFLMVFAGVIAFSIIYNVTSVSLAERQREFASLRVLGLTHGEVGRIMYNENLILAVVGIILGIPLGIAICLWLVHFFDTDLFRLPFHIERRTYGSSIILTLFFVFLANLTARRKVVRLDLVEVLKERE